MLTPHTKRIYNFVNIYMTQEIISKHFWSCWATEKYTKAQKSTHTLLNCSQIYMDITLLTHLLLSMGCVQLYFLIFSKKYLAIQTVK